MTTAEQGGPARAADAVGPGGHPRHRLDALIHAPVRLSIVACLAAADKAEFGFVRDTVEVSDSVLSKQVTLLADAGYVRVRKGYVGKRPRTWLSLTAHGRRAFEGHLAALTAIAALPARPAAAGEESDG
jgi:DNA-binding MarR family transcriptional regulator